MIINFKNFITRSLMGTKKQNFNLFTDLLNNVRLFDLNESTSSTPHVTQMSTSVEEIMNITQDAFKKLIHELITTSHELKERNDNEKKQKRIYEDEINDLKFQNDKLTKKSSNNIKSAKINNNNNNEPIIFPTHNTSKSSEEETSSSSPLIIQRRNSNAAELESYRKKFEENKTRIFQLEDVITKLKQEIEMMMKYSTINNTEQQVTAAAVDMMNNNHYKQNRNSSIPEPSIMFTKLDAERNAKRLKKAINKGMVSEQEYQVSCLFAH